MASFTSKGRKFIMHAAHPVVGVSRIERPALSERQWIAPLSVDIFSRAAEQSLSRKLIERILLFYPEANWLVQSHVDDLYGKFPFESHCVVILGGTTSFLPELLDQFASFARRGGSLMVLNAGGQNSLEWKQFAQTTLGVRFEDAQPPSEKMSLRIAPGRHFHPVVQEVPSWEFDGKRSAILDSRSELFLEGVSSINRQPVAWGLDAGGNRAFCTLLGTPEDFNQPPFFRLLWNALHWTLEIA